MVSVDPGSPAQRAGLTAPEGMTTVGATSVTAGYLLGPVGLLVSPLLRKTGQLGVTGDMIVAIDDHRVSLASAMNRVLARRSPGETIWLTLMRITKDGQAKNEKIPVVLGSLKSVDTANSSGPEAAALPRSANIPDR